jgi:CPA2 family monovalent cation:H+ antiporter-2
VAICFGTAAVSSLAGVSLALGAFLAGLVVSESRYSEQALSEVLPLRTIFNAVFFVSVGMLLDLRFVAANLPLVLGVAALVVVVKLVTATVGVLVLGYPVRIAAAVGLALAQIGEFSFVLERAGRAEGLAPMGLAGTGEQVFIAATVLLMLLTPLLVTSGPRLGTALARTRLRHLSGGAPSPASDPADAPMEDHVIVVGYGPTGERLVQVLGETGIPCVVVEMNPEAVRRLEAAGQAAIYGDGSRTHILETAGIHRAKMVVAVVNDPPARARIVQLARYLNPTVQVVARARYLSEVDALQALGADIVVPEEMETTVRIFTQVLGAYMVPPAEIEAQVRAIRAQDYGVMRGSIQEAHLMVLQGLDEEGMHTRAVAVRAGAPAAGQTLEALALRRDHHLTVLAVRRGAQTVASPAGSFTVEPGDRLVMVGRAAHFADCAHLFRDLPAAPAEA